MTDAPLADRVARMFAPDGPLARAFEQFEPRPGQREFAARVARVIARGGTLLAEAGTGTGKTLAYLVPAVLSGTRVLISTGTRNLQDQVFYKDLPALATALGRPIAAACMKGRTNYLCRHRFDRLVEMRAALPPDERAWVARVEEWLDATDTGDRAEIEDLPDDLPLWSEMSATSEQCLGRDCPRYGDCFVTHMRDHAAGADVVIVNHHLLCADAAVRQSAFGEVIPACRVAIVDEAHQLEDVVTHYFGIAVSTYRIDEFARDATQAVGAVAADEGGFAVAVNEAITGVQHAARRLFEDARIEVPPRSGGDRVTLSPAAAERLGGTGTALRDALGRLAGLVAARRSASETVPGDLVAIAGRAATIAADLDVLLDAARPDVVHFVEARGRGVWLRAAPIDVDAIVRDRVLAGRDATVLTSATLTVDGSFDYVTSRLGLASAEAVRLPSEFDYAEQAVLYLPPDMPDPRAPEYNDAAADAIADLLDRTRGRAFVLFTSYAALRHVQARLEDHLRWPLFVQGTAPRSALLRDFRATPHAVLLATSSFWQGVDVAGDALSCVIIDRLPFASPADPLVAARIAAIAARGGRPFHDYQVPLATLTLLQGLGRLIRTRTDRGVLAVLDPRLTRMRYGQRFLASLPPARVTSRIEDVDAFLAPA